MTSPSGGTVRFHGRPLSTWDVLGLRRRVGLVGEHPMLLTDHVLDDLRVGRPDLDDDGAAGLLERGFDYATLDPGRGLLFIAHLGASEVIEVDVRANRVVRTITGLPGVHGVLVVPGLHRVYATATGANQMATLDEDSGAVLHRTPTGEYPDGLAYDPVRGTVWTTNESGGSETVIDATTGTVRGTVDLGGEAGNVAYDPVGSGQILVDVQTSNEVAVIDPVTLAVTRRIPLPGCDRPGGARRLPGG